MSIRGCGDGGSEWRHTIASTETSGDDLDLGLIRTWGPEGALFAAEVFGTVENGGVLCLERDGRHSGGEWEIEDKTYDGKHGI